MFKTITYIMLGCLITGHTLACEFKTPNIMHKERSSWIGECKNNLANGLGIIREFDLDSNVLNVYYGKMVNGEPVQGVIEISIDGFTAGKFKNGKLVVSDSRQDYINAFNIGAKASEKVADFYKSKNNLSSFKYYLDKAEILRNALD